MSTVLVCAACSVAADDLDAALNARKKKVNRRVYSERVQMDDQSLLVPKTSTEEERALDRELEQLERQFASQFVPRNEMTRRHPVAPAPMKPENWLTPSVLNAEDGDAPSLEKSDSGWVNEELERRKALQKHKEDLEKEEAIVNKMLQEDSRKPFTEDPSPLKSYEMTLRNTLSPTKTRSTSQTGVLDPLGSLRPIKKTKPVNRNTLFSPTARSGSSVMKSPFSSTPSRPPSAAASNRPLRLRPRFDSSVLEPGGESSWDWNKTKTERLPPLERVRKSSPIHQEDPFDNDFMPGLRTSIWE